MFAAVGPFDGYLTTFKPHENGPDGKPYPTYRCIFPEPPPPGTVANCAEVGVLGAAVGVIGTLQATEVLKEIVGIGESLAGRLLLYDARAARFTEIKIAWDPANPLSGRAPTHPRSVDPRGRGSRARSARPDGDEGGREAWRSAASCSTRTAPSSTTGAPGCRSTARSALYAAGGDRAWPTSCCGSAGTIPPPTASRRARRWPPAASTTSRAAFAAHPRVAPAGQLAAGIERIFCAGGAEHSALIDGARETLVELSGAAFARACHQRLRGRPGGVAGASTISSDLSTSPWAAIPGFGSKPDPRMVRGFCEAVGIAPGEVAMVGDAVHDLAMGRAAGVGLNVGVLSGTSGREDLEDFADLILASINDLPALAGFQSS